MIPSAYTPLPFGKYYYQELKKEYELWPSYDNPSNPHMAAIPICPFMYWLIQCYCFNCLLINPHNEPNENNLGEPLIYGLPKIPGAPEITGAPELPIIVQQQ